MRITRKHYAALDAAYARMEKRYRLRKGSEALAAAVSFRDNHRMPVHGWFPFKEGYSAQILDAAGIRPSQYLRNGLALLDPFCGSGTTLLAADLQHHWDSPRIGIEVNPFLAFVANTKTAWRDYSAKRVQKLAAQLVKKPLECGTGRSHWPSLSSLTRSDLISPRRVNAILDLAQRIRNAPAPESPLMLLALAAIIEPLAYFRKDGRALRITRDEGEIARRRSLSVKRLFFEKTDEFASDLLSVSDIASDVRQARIVHGDARKAHSHAEAESVGLAFYSPPYLNHIDYTEVYKVESTLLGFFDTPADILSQRKRTLRSHASVGLGTLEYNAPQHMQLALEIASDLITKTGWSWHSRARSLIMAYCADIEAALKAQYQLLCSGGLAVCVVGNSAHGCGDHRIPVCTDLFIASAAETVGFHVEKILVARHVLRRNEHGLLRESLVVLRK